MTKRSTMTVLGTATMILSSVPGRPDEAPPPAPPPQSIEACVKQMDVNNQWSFDWKLLEIGAPRHPRNSYEALYAPSGPAWTRLYGYPVHVVFSVNGRAAIDSVYWLIRDARGRWQIPALCALP